MTERTSTPKSASYWKRRANELETQLAEEAEAHGVAMNDLARKYELECKLRDEKIDECFLLEKALGQCELDKAPLEDLFEQCRQLLRYDGIDKERVRQAIDRIRDIVHERLAFFDNGKSLTEGE